jgi:hypothetical protein
MCTPSRSRNPGLILAPSSVPFSPFLAVLAWVTRGIFYLQSSNDKASYPRGEVGVSKNASTHCPLLLEGLKGGQEGLRRSGQELKTLGSPVTSAFFEESSLFKGSKLLQGYPSPAYYPSTGLPTPLALPQTWGPHLGRGGGPGGGASAELRLHSSDGGRGREDELRGQRNSAA